MTEKNPVREFAEEILEVWREINTDTDNSDTLRGNLVFAQTYLMQAAGMLLALDALLAQREKEQ